MKKSENNSNKKSLKLFGLIISAILFAALLWFIILPIAFNAGSSFLKDVLSKKEDVKFEAFSPEAFAYDIGDSWEVNASARIKGFQHNEKEKQFSIHLAYSTDLVNSAGDTVKNIFEDEVEKSRGEIFADFSLEAQFELDSTYRAGDYEIFFYVKDKLSGRTAKTSAKFKLSHE